MATILRRRRSCFVLSNLYTNHRFNTLFFFGTLFYEQNFSIHIYFHGKFVIFFVRINDTTHDTQRERFILCTELNARTEHNACSMKRKKHRNSRIINSSSSRSSSNNNSSSRNSSSRIQQKLVYREKERLSEKLTENIHSNTHAHTPSRTKTNATD